MSYSDIIDDSALNALSDMVAGDPAFLAEMIDAFTEEAPAMLALMQSSLAIGDASELQEVFVQSPVRAWRGSICEQP